MRRMFIGPLSNLFDENHGRLIDLSNTSNRQSDLYYVMSGNNKVGAGIDIALPGVIKENVSINIEGNKIIVEVKKTAPKNNVEYIDGYINIDKSEFSTSYDLDPEVFNLNKITCNMDNGILTIIVPFNEKPKARSIKIG